MGVMSEHDNEEFNIKDMRTDLDEQLAAEIDVQSNHIFLEIQSRIVNSTAGQNSSDAFDSLAKHTTSTEGQSTQQSGVIDSDNTASIPLLHLKRVMLVIIQIKHTLQQPNSNQKTWQKNKRQIISKARPPYLSR